MRIALVSLDQVWEDKEANKQKCEYYTDKASQNDCELVIFPEMTLTGFSMNTELIKEEEVKSTTIHFFTQLARKNNISIAFGVVFRKRNKATNNLVVINSSGNLLASYAKVHPFSYSGENNYYIGGEKLKDCSIGNAVIGLTICYDLRFPEIFQGLSKKCNIIVNIANWPEKRINHWNTLLEARSIENQSFIIGVNRTGIDGNNISYIKSSAVFDPSGMKLEPMDSYSDLDIYEINPDNVDSIRKAFPVKKDRIPEFYKTIL